MHAESIDQDTLNYTHAKMDINGIVCVNNGNHFYKELVGKRFLIHEDNPFAFFVLQEDHLLFQFNYSMDLAYPVANKLVHQYGFIPKQLSIREN